MAKPVIKAGRVVAAIVLLAISVHSVPAIAKVAKPFAFADVDGDGKKDGFFSTFVAGRNVEIGVKLTKFGNKYVKIYVDDIKYFRKSDFRVENRKPFLEYIRVGCYDDGCPNYRVEAISALERSISPELLNVGYNASAKVLCMDEKGDMIEVWYSD